MKINSHIFIITISLGAILMFASESFAQKTPTVGGFSPVSVKDAKVIEAAVFAVSAGAEKFAAEIELVAIKKAEIQIVAGTNYRLCMKVTVLADYEDLAEDEEPEDVTGFVTVIVYRDLDGGFLLKNWKVADGCGKKTAKTK